MSGRERDHGFTPGPWEAGYCTKESTKVDVWCEEGDVAVVYGGTADEVVANARLVAAAPRLFAACERVMDLLEDKYDGAPDSPTRWLGEPLVLLRDALAKAKGGGDAD